MIAVIGKGYVGSAYVDFFPESIFYDPNVKGSVTKEEVNKCEGAVICVPTEMKEDRTCDTSIVEETIKWLAVPHILIKSTIPPGTTKKFIKKYKKNLVFSPEYIGQSRYYTPPKYLNPTDVKTHPFVIFGGIGTEYWVEVFKEIMGPAVSYLQTNTTTAELVKYADNTWGAMKITYFNELYEICKVFKVDFNAFRELLLQDPAIEPMHTAVFKHDRGFGGKCFPKDLNAIIKACEEKGYNPEFLKEILNSNDKFRRVNESIPKPMGR